MLSTALFRFEQTQSMDHADRRQRRDGNTFLAQAVTAEQRDPRTAQLTEYHRSRSREISRDVNHEYDVIKVQHVYQPTKADSFYMQPHSERQAPTRNGGSYSRRRHTRGSMNDLHSHATTSPQQHARQQRPTRLQRTRSYIASSSRSIELSSPTFGTYMPLTDIVLATHDVNKSAFNRTASDIVSSVESTWTVSVISSTSDAAAAPAAVLTATPVTYTVRTPITHPKCDAHLQAQDAVVMSNIKPGHDEHLVSEPQPQQQQQQQAQEPVKGQPLANTCSMPTATTDREDNRSNTWIIYLTHS